MTPNLDGVVTGETNVTDEVTPASSGPAPLGPLSAMVKAVLDEPGMSTRILAARTYDEAKGKEIVTKDTWSKIQRGVLPGAPTAEELEWMARAIHRPVDVLREAAAIQYLGYRPVHLSGYDDDTRRIIVQTVALPPGERRKVRVWLETLPIEDSSPN